MQAVLDFGVEHPSCNEVIPPSPNSSSDSVQRREDIARAHTEFQLGDPIIPSTPEPTPPSPVFPGFGPASPDIGSVDASVEVVPDVDPVMVEPVDAPAPEVPSPTGPVTDASYSTASEPSVTLPADDPAPKTVAGGCSPVDAFIEFGTVHYPPDASNWYRFSSSPTQFKFITGSDGREFVFCMPDADNVDITHVDRAGYRDVGFQVRPSTRAVGGQTDPTTPPVSPPGTPPGTPPASESVASSVDTDAAPTSDAGSKTVSSASLDDDRKQAHLAAAELAK